MRIGRLRHRVTFQTATETSDGHGGVTEASATVGPVRMAAEIAPLDGRDLERARQIDPRAVHKLTVRYWRSYATDLVGGRVSAIWHDGATDRTLEVVEPPREMVPRSMLEMVCREAA